MTTRAAIVAVAIMAGNLTPAMGAPTQAGSFDCSQNVGTRMFGAASNTCDKTLSAGLADLVAAGGGGGVVATRPMDCTTMKVLGPTSDPSFWLRSEHIVDTLEEGELYYTVCYYADTDPHEFAWGDYFTYMPGMEGPLLEAVARQLAAEIPLTYPVPATTPSIDGQQLVGLDTWLWIDPAGWQPVELSLDLAGYTVTVTAAPTAVEWDLGERNNHGDSDGIVTCPGPGTPWDPDGGEGQDTDCSYNYQWVPEPPDTTYPASATLVWDVTWTATGQAGGSLGTNATTTTFDLTVTERQAVVCYDTRLEDCNVG